MAAFPILKKRVMTPKIPQPQYRLAASISIKGRGARRPASRPAEAVVDHARLLQLPLQSQLPAGQLASKDPLGFESKQKQYSSKKTDKRSNTWLCQIRSIIVSIRYLQCDLGQFTANTYRQSKCSQTTVNCIYAGLVIELANWVLSQLDLTSQLVWTGIKGCNFQN